MIPNHKQKPAKRKRKLPRKKTWVWNFGLSSSTKFLLYLIPISALTYFALSPYERSLTTAFGYDLGALHQISQKLHQDLKEQAGKLKQYEQELKQRLDVLDAMLGEIHDLSAVDSFNATNEMPGETEAKDAIGEGEESQELGPQALLPFELFEEPLGETLLERADAKTVQFAHVPVGYPIRGNITSRYGMRRSPFTRKWRMHQGIDIRLERRSPIQTTADGIVEHASYKGAYGRTIVVNHGNGLKTLYGHLSDIQVEVGDRVCRGQQIGTVGNTGRSTGPHLHYEIRVHGKTVNPMTSLNSGQLVQFLL